MEHRLQSWDDLQDLRSKEIARNHKLNILELGKGIEAIFEVLSVDGKVPIPEIVDPNLLNPYSDTIRDLAYSAVISFELTHTDRVIFPQSSSHFPFITLGFANRVRDDYCYNTFGNYFLALIAELQRRQLSRMESL